MTSLSASRILLIVCLICESVTLILESIAVANDNYWNDWLDRNSNSSHPPASLTSRRGASISDINTELRRDGWLEPCALILIGASVSTGIGVFAVLLGGKLREARKFWLYLSIQAFGNLAITVLILFSFHKYETGYDFLTTATAKSDDNFTYGHYEVLRHCQLSASVTPPTYSKPIEHACQLKELKVTCAFLCILNVLLYIIVLVISSTSSMMRELVENALRNTDGDTIPRSTSNQALENAPIQVEGENEHSVEVASSAEELQ